MWELDHKEGRVPKKWCLRTVVLEKTSEISLDSKEIKPVNPKGHRPWIFTGRTDVEAEAPILWPVLGVHWKDWCWSWNSKPLATWREELTHWKRPWCWERLKAGGEGDNNGWDGWMASLIQRAWTWANSGRCWGAGRTCMLQSTGVTRVEHNLATEHTHTHTHTHTHLHPYVYSSTNFNGQERQASYTSAATWADRQDVVYTYAKEYDSARKREWNTAIQQYVLTMQQRG